jgi:hypothetical protein
MITFASPGWLPLDANGVSARFCLAKRRMSALRIIGSEHEQTGADVRSRRFCDDQLPHGLICGSLSQERAAV